MAPPARGGAQTLMRLGPGRSAHLTPGHLPSLQGGCGMAPKSTQQLPPTPRGHYLPGLGAVPAPSGGPRVAAGDSHTGDGLALVFRQAGGSHGRRALTCFRPTGPPGHSPNCGGRSAARSLAPAPAGTKVALPEPPPDLRLRSRDPRRSGAEGRSGKGRAGPPRPQRMLIGRTRLTLSCAPASNWLNGARSKSLWCGNAAPAGRGVGTEPKCVPARREAGGAPSARGSGSLSPPRAGLRASPE